MSINQLHGKEFENIIKKTFNNIEDIKCNSKQDIPAKFDIEKNLDTSIKTKKVARNGNETIELADARSFFSQRNSFRLILGIYEQNKDIKYFNMIKEYEINDNELNNLTGNYGNDIINDVKDIHETILKYPEGEHNSVSISIVH
jgi:hypothetical protein